MKTIEERQNLLRYTEDIGEIGGKYRAARTFPATQQSTSWKFPVTVADSKTLGENFCSRFIVATHERVSNEAYHRAQPSTILLRSQENTYFRGTWFATTPVILETNGIGQSSRFFFSFFFQQFYELDEISLNFSKCFFSLSNICSRRVLSRVSSRLSYRSNKEMHNSRTRHATKIIESFPPAFKQSGSFAISIELFFQSGVGGIQRQRRIIGLFLALASDDCLSGRQLVVRSNDFHSCRQRR